MKYIKALVVLILLTGCFKNETIWGDVPFIKMEQETIVLTEHIELCKINPNSIFCRTTKDIGDIRPTKQYTLEVLHEMNNNFKYTANSIWIYNNNIYEYLKGDCEDIASTMAQHMVNEGVATKYLSLVYRKISNTSAHIFLAVDTVDAGLLHLDYDNSGYPIEPEINYHMVLSNAGVNKWIKGNIK